VNAAAASFNMEQEDGSGTATDLNQTAISGLSSKQVQRLLNVIDVPKGGYKKLSGKPP